MENLSELAGPQCPILVEHIVEILSRLPIKSLMRFKCVSKSWRSLISSTEFSALHSKKVLDDKESFFRSRRVLFNHYHSDMVVDPGQHGPYSIDLDQFLQNHNADDNTTYCACEITPTELEFILDKINPTPREYRMALYFHKICFCINLVLCRTFEGYYYLVNPATREMKNLPKTISVKTFPICGLGFDLVSNDYKVIDVDEIKSHDGRRYAVCNIYSTKTDSSSWRQIECHSRYVPSHFDDATGIFLNGDIHFIGYDYDADEKGGIVSFVVAEERFYEIELPTSKRRSSQKLGVFRDCLCVTVESWDGDAYDEFWVMKEYKVSESWTKMKIFNHLRSLSHIGFSTKTHDVMAYDNSLCMYECDRELQRLQVRDLPKIGDLVGVYVEGIFPLTDESNSVSQAYIELQAELDEFHEKYDEEFYEEANVELLV